jgi:iron(III) transport system substrate-binding protein
VVGSLQAVAIKRHRREDLRMTWLRTLLSCSVRAVLCAALSGALLLAASAGPAKAADQALIDAARKEGSVVWYTSFVEDQAARPLAAAFEKKYPGIHVQLVSGTATDLLTKLLAEARAGSVQADVHHGGSSVWPLVQAGVVVPYVAESAKAYPPELQDPQGLWTADVLYFLVPAINTDAVSAAQAPKNFQDLLDPRWKGKIAWTTQMTQGGAPGFIGTMLLDRGEQAGMAFLKQLSAQRIVNVPSNQRVVLDQVIDGEYSIALSTFINHSYISAHDGAPVRALPLDPATETLDTLFLLKGPHPNAGKLFIDFSLSDEGQRVFRDAGYIPADPAVDALDPTMKPAGGHFRAVILTPAIVEKGLKHWIDIYNELFK